MGEDFIEKMSRRAKHLRNLAFERELQQKKLFSDLPELYTRQYSGCALEDAGAVQTGAAIVRDSRAGYLEFIQDNAVRARVEAGDDVWLRAAMATDHRCGHLLEVEVLEEPGLGGYFSFRCRPELSGESDGGPTQQPA